MPMTTAKEQQFLRAYDAHCDGIFRYCYGKVVDRQKAKDYVEKTYCRAWQKIGESGGSESDMEIFLYNTATTVMMEDSQKGFFSFNRAY